MGGRWRLSVKLTTVMCDHWLEKPPASGQDGGGGPGGASASRRHAGPAQRPTVSGREGEWGAGGWWRLPSAGRTLPGHPVRGNVTVQAEVSHFPAPPIPTPIPDARPKPCHPWGLGAGVLANQSKGVRVVSFAYSFPQPPTRRWPLSQPGVPPRRERAPPHRPARQYRYGHTHLATRLFGPLARFSNGLERP